MIRTREVPRFLVLGGALVLGMSATACGLRTDSGDFGEVRTTHQAVEFGTAVSSPNALEATIVTLNVINPTGCSDKPGGICSSFCTGTLIRPNWVLTAGHCVASVPGVPASTTGRLVRTFDGRMANWKTAHVHPDMALDAGLIELDVPLDTLAPIELFSGSDSDILGESAQLYGFGPLSSNVQPGSCATNNPCSASQICVPVDSTSVDCRDVLSPPPFPQWPLSTAVSTIHSLGNSNNVPIYNKKYFISTPRAIPGDSGGPSFLTNDELVAVNGGWQNKAYARVFRDWVEGVIEPTTADTFASDRLISGFFGILEEQPATGDFNGDGRADLIAFVRGTQTGDAAGDVFVSLANADGTYQPGERWHEEFADGPTASIFPKVGDFNGDSLDDILYFDQRDASVHVVLSEGGTGFGAVATWHDAFSYPGEVPDVGDFDGDGRDDLVTFERDAGSGDVWVSHSCSTVPGQILSKGCSGVTASFGTRQLWAADFSHEDEAPRVGDFDGNNLADIVTFTGNGDVEVALTVRTLCASDADCAAAGGTCGLTNEGQVCSLLQGAAAGPKQLWATNFAFGGDDPEVADFNGDDFDDIINFQVSSTGDVFVSLSQRSSFAPRQLWRAGFVTNPAEPGFGDTNNDGRADILRFIRSSETGGAEGNVWLALSEGLPAAWACAPSSYDANDGCDCDCGTVDPDCADGQAVNNCGLGVACDPHGVCEFGSGSGDATPIPKNTQMGGTGFGTTGEVWLTATSDLQGWWASEIAGRTIEVNGVPVTNGQMPLPAPVNGIYYFHFSAGDRPWASWVWW